MKLISDAEAAEKLGVDITRIQALIKEGRLPTRKVDGHYLINDSDLKLVADRKPGGPPKTKEDSKAEKSVARKRVRQKDSTRLLKTLS